MATPTSRHDAWQAGRSYDAYMGRWSRQLAPRFLDWLQPRNGLDWLEIGCGTGALSATILARCSPESLLAIDPSEGFIATAKANVADDRAAFQVGDAQALTVASASRDIIVSGLVLNFVPDRARALAEMRRVGRAGATVAFYVWDYSGGGVEFVHAFWQAATALDCNAADLTEDRRFPFCSADGLQLLMEPSGLQSIESVALDMPMVFKDFADYWDPFTLGAGPAPGYCMSLQADARHRLREQLRANLCYRRDGSIAFNARVWAVRSTVP